LDCSLAFLYAEGPAGLPTMRNGTEIEDAVLDLLCSRSPRGERRAAGRSATRRRGTGLDSIAMVELLLDFERQFGILAELLGSSFS
jgi:acyl carrier protein